jgi:hypothetical protein
MQRVLERYFLVWAAVLPITSLLVLPGIQGTTPAYLLAFGSVGWLPFIRREIGVSYVKSLLPFLAVWLVLFIGSQAALFFSHVQTFSHLRMIDVGDSSVFFRRSLLTQSLYLFACFLTFLFFRYVYRSEWRRYLFLGGWVLAGYGIYEWIFYLLFRQTGDFIANRSFGGDHPGSWSQILHFGRLEMVRIKSVTGEPSFFALSAMPYLIFALHARRWYLAAALLFTLILSFSTSAYFALLVLAIYCFVAFRAWKQRHLLIAVCLAGAIGIALLSFPAVYEAVIEDKLTGRSQSSVERQWIYESAWFFWLDASPLVKLFGIGFGYAYVIPLLGGVLVNTGVVGVFVYFAAFLVPLIRLPNTQNAWAPKSTLVVLLFLLSASIPEFAYPTTWMVLGLAYRQLDRSKQRNKTAAKSGDFESLQQRIKERTKPFAPVMPKQNTPLCQGMDPGKSSSTSAR